MAKRREKKAAVGAFALRSEALINDIVTGNWNGSS